MRELHIAGRRIADDTEAYVIAEIGHNHGGSLERARDLFRRAAENGAHAAKLQKRENKTLFTRAMYDQPYTGRNSYGPTYGAHREALEFGRDDYAALTELAAEVGIDFFSTAFDMPSVDFLMDFDPPAIKIASADLTNTPLLAYAAKTGKPLIVSTGGGTMDDVRRACDTVLPLNPNLALLQCTAVYPAAPADLNLAVIGTFRAEYPDVVVGFSGHDLGPDASFIAYALGARVIEKHFTLDQSLPGTDHAFSLDPDQLVQLTRGLKRTAESIGSPIKTRSDAEASAVIKMGKKLVARHDLRPGHVLTENDIAIKSPGDGLKPYELERVLGMTLTVALSADDAIRWEHLVGPGLRVDERRPVTTGAAADARR
ncbi:N-acetylneuraminate synthase family protein [Microbispora sp. GKU 823]|uniref:N-acetylneuraminate synthase family protein n=1 Tax=Microbispora sp. GKU 823 TaxID=1652100 RepID=UPI0009A3D1EF|nr:N-acetylneuraminate synthase family protein [Microbispora sp. GKU 823]OPG12353.1 N-acetylneuraminate synthase [Microbispora sp. GKU 823]